MKKHVVLIEDEPAIRDNYRAAFERRGYRVSTYGDRPAAWQVLRQSLRLLKPGGWLVLVDLHPAGPWLRLPQQLFCALFETDTATAMLEDDLPSQLHQLGFTAVRQELLAGRALQRIPAAKPSSDTASS